MAGKYGRLIGNRVFEKAPRAVRSDDRDPAVEMKQRQQRERARAREQLQRPPAGGYPGGAPLSMQQKAPPKRGPSVRALRGVRALLDIAE
jgi:hypothetical protein